MREGAASPDAPAGAPASSSSEALTGTAIVLTGGALLSASAFVNGRLRDQLGSPLLAASVNTTSAWIVILLLTLAASSRREALRGVLTGAIPVRRLYVLLGAVGALFHSTVSAAAPRLGIALLTMALVAGQTTGGMIIDRSGWGPAATQGFTAHRLLGTALAWSAVAVGVIGTSGDLRPELLALAVLAGALMSVQIAAGGHLTRSTGDPFVAGVLQVGVGVITILTISLVVTHGTAPGGWSAPPVLFIGGLLATVSGVAMNRFVGAIGVLRVMLAVIAGQVVGALAFDLAAPPPGKSVTALTVLGVVLAVLAVYVSAQTSMPRPGRARRRRREADRAGPTPGL